MSASAPRVAVVGATGAVGSTMLEVMAERGFPAREVVPLASARSAGRTVRYGDEELMVRLLEDAVVDGFDIALFSAGAACRASGRRGSRRPAAS